MSRQSAGQRWCSLVLLAVFLSLFLFYGLPAAAFRIGRAIEAGRLEAAGWEGSAGEQIPEPVEESVHDERAAFFARASQSVRPAVVRIEAIVPVHIGNRAGDTNQGELVTVARGCGVVIDSSGYVLTSRRLIARAGEIVIRLARSPSLLPAKVAGSDAGTELAVLKFDPPAGGVTAAPWGVPDQAGQEDVEAGDYVMAIGNAQSPGDFVWIGQVSSSGRDVAPALCDLGECIHTTAVNPLNCGGPLVNRHGKIVGINTSLRFWGNVADGVAVRAAVARQVFDELRHYGSVSRGWLGLFVHKAAPVAPGPGDLPREARAAAIDYVVAGSPAEEAGLRAGDMLLKFAGAPFGSTADLRRQIARTPPNATVAVSVLRGTAVFEESIVVGRHPSVAPALPGEREWGFALLEELSPEESKQLADDLPGVVIQTIEPQCRAPGLAPGDVIVSVNGVPTPSLEAFCREVGALVGDSAASPVTLECSSRGSRRPVAIRPR